MMLRVQGRYYPDFLMKEVMPFVGRNYRVADGAREYWTGRIVVGRADRAVHRDGAAGSDWAVAGGESVAVGVAQADDQGEPVGENLAGENLSGGGNCRSWKRGAEPEVVDDVRELAAILRRAVLSEKRLRLVIEDGAGHNEAAWAERFPEALRFLFGQ